MLNENKKGCADSSSMRTFTDNEPLTDAELDRLGDFLKSCKGGKAMNLEELDGFFAALIAGPETVMPSEYNREVFRGEMGETCEFSNVDEAREILNLMMRHPKDFHAIRGLVFGKRNKKICFATSAVRHDMIVV